ncbi:MAG: hypothetical protein ACQEQV_05425 [Fibrobacterota bacterium]
MDIVPPRRTVPDGQHPQVKRDGPAGQSLAVKQLKGFSLVTPHAGGVLYLDPLWAETMKGGLRLPPDLMDLFITESPLSGRALHSALTRFGLSSSGQEARLPAELLDSLNPSFGTEAFRRLQVTVNNTLYSMYRQGGPSDSTAGLFQSLLRVALTTSPQIQRRVLRFLDQKGERRKKEDALRLTSFDDIAAVHSYYESLRTEFPPMRNVSFSHFRNAAEGLVLFSDPRGHQRDFLSRRELQRTLQLRLEQDYPNVCRNIDSAVLANAAVAETVWDEGFLSRCENVVQHLKKNGTPSQQGRTAAALFTASGMIQSNLNGRDISVTDLQWGFTAAQDVSRIIPLVRTGIDEIGIQQRAVSEAVPLVRRILDFLEGTGGARPGAEQYLSMLGTVRFTRSMPSDQPSLYQTLLFIRQKSGPHSLPVPLERAFDALYLLVQSASVRFSPGSFVLSFAEKKGKKRGGALHGAPVREPVGQEVSFSADMEQVGHVECHVAGARKTGVNLTLSCRKLRTLRWFKEHKNEMLAAWKEKDGGCADLRIVRCSGDSRYDAARTGMDLQG